MEDPQTKAKDEIKKLIDHYEAVKLGEREKKYSERDVETKFIEPLLDALGWDPRSEEVKKRYPTGKGAGRRKVVDYALQVGGVGEEPKILIEAKKFNLPEGLDGKEQDPSTKEYITYPEKVIQYAWNKRVEWTVLTNFKEIRVYNAHWSKKPDKALWFKAAYDQFLDEEVFKKIWVLSRESVAAGRLDIFEVRGKRKPVGRQFLDDLIKCRLILIDNIHKNNELEPEALKECAQRILDRLVIMRSAEDLEVETPDLLRREILKEKGGWYELKQYLFRYFDRRFNSRIFAKHKCDELNIDDRAIEDIVKILYNGTGESSGYNFDQIPADILGSMYEDYIGYILKEEGEDFKLKKEMAGRKVSGIYYTPTYVVEHIVENTLGELLKDKKPSEVREIRVLDPACGSGSFLIKAQDVLKRYYEETKERLTKKEGGKLDLYISEEYASLSKDVLTQNIYGVDLDPQAAEIASVNLSLKVLANMKEEMKLPEVMGENIKVGNSLVSGSQEELKKYFENPLGKRPFNWEKEFPEVFKAGGFDVVIGNPPYVGWAKGKIPRPYKDYFQEKYPEIYNGKNDLFYYFVYTGLKKLKENGYFGFITSRYFMESVWAKKLRNFIAKNFYIEKIVDFRERRVFGSANVHTCILIVKNKKELNNKIEVRLRSLSSEPFHISQKSLIDGIWVLEVPKVQKILDKINQDSVEITTYFDIKDTKLTALDDVYIVSDDAVKSMKLEQKYLRKFLTSKDISDYSYTWDKKYMIDISKNTKVDPSSNLHKYLKSNKGKIRDRNKRRKEDLGYGLARPMMDYPWDEPKLFCPSRNVKNQFVIDKEGMVGTRHNLTVLFPKNWKLAKDSLELPYFLAILNSKLFNFYFKRASKKMGKSCEYLPKFVNKLRVKIPSLKMREQLTKLASRMLTLSKQHNETLRIFQKILGNISDSKTRLNLFSRAYFKEGSTYGIDLTKTEKLVSDEEEGKVTEIGVGDEPEFLTLKARWGGEDSLEPVIKICINDKPFRKFFYYTIKTYLAEKSQRKRSWGEGKIVDVVLRAVEVPKFAVNINENKKRIKKLMQEFFKHSPIKDGSLSEIGREINDTGQEIDRKVYELYKLTDEEIAIIEGV